jgi:PAS domain S-box-containing protein
MSNLYAANEYISLALGLTGLIAAVYSFYRWGWPIVHERLELRRKRRDAIMELPAALDRLQDVAGQIRQIRNAVLPNGGSSIPDSIKRIEEGIAAGAAQRQALAKEISTIAHTIRANQNANPDAAGFEASPSGRVISVTKTYTRWTGLEVAELLGWNWINAVEPAHRQRVRDEFQSAIQDVRNCTMRYWLVDTDGGRMEVEVTMTPIPEGEVPCEKFVGTIYRVDQHAQRAA